jgi:GMP synthase (glutamine-hydrolysing)
MVTDAIPWIAAVEHWISACIKQSIPLLGICFGHQLIIQAAGGRIDYHPQGLEIGTVTIHTLRHAAEDRLLNGIPKVFTAHVSHSQTAVALPGDAVRLAENSFEKSHIVRIGSTAWGLQFHPEFSTEVMCSYIEHHAAQIRSNAGSPEQHIKTIAETPFPLKIMRNFYHIIRDASV